MAFFYQEVLVRFPHLACHYSCKCMRRTLLRSRLLRQDENIATELWAILLTLGIACSQAKLSFLRAERPRLQGLRSINVTCTEKDSEFRVVQPKLPL